MVFNLTHLRIYGRKIPYLANLSPKMTVSETLLLNWFIDPFKPVGLQNLLNLAKQV
jgi:hypothetical protein